MTRTRWRDLATIAGLTGVFAFAVLRVVAARSTLPTVPWLAPVTVIVVGLALIVTAVILRPRLQRKSGTKPVAPLLAGRLVALAFAASRAGAFVVGLYVGWLLAGLSVSNALDTSFGRQRAFLALLTALGGLVVVFGGLMLERALVITNDGDDDSGRSDGRPGATGGRADDLGSPA
jgi:hypothetical protein